MSGDDTLLYVGKEGVNSVHEAVSYEDLAILVQGLDGASAQHVKVSQEGKEALKKWYDAEKEGYRTIWMDFRVRTDTALQYTMGIYYRDALDMRLSPEDFDGHSVME
ncbi:hypothetical protein K469DRAFT_685959 [Zopfia rhizophila CBS 207.26]|uniref:Uncharacterized protein n=1 Tax=Zopfia rhizophila CBS 207.26 TaxID=1314779 RepID=A0A6A6E8P7_9PEZI|nr:hypothetical protein K469DRAFT_685959 [Zopfia rhizophila CBS 207.26]